MAFFKVDEVEIQGASGTHYNFAVYTTDVQLTGAPCICAIANFRLDPANGRTYTFFYVDELSGDTEDFNFKLEHFIQVGANRLCIASIGSADERTKTLQDLRAKFRLDAHPEQH